MSSSAFEVSEEVKELIDEIASKYNWGPISQVKYSPGTEAGDGYASKHVAVDIVRESDTLKLFVKYALKIKGTEGMGMDKIYQVEAYFYDAVYPAFGKFLREKGFYKGLENVPKPFGTSSKNVIALENVKDKGFVLSDRTRIMNDRHISLVLKSFARFHATSFAFKDQKRSEYDKLVNSFDGDMWASHADDAPMVKVFQDMVTDGLSKLDPEKDKEIIEKCNVDVMTKVITDIPKNLNEYSILIKGDCWTNNIMFLYENDDREDPIDIMHVDWQLLQTTSPVYDISYFFFTVASPEALNKLDFFLDVYYTELTDRIKRLGSDPKVVYPRSVFDKEWKDYCKYGLTMAFMIFKVMLINKDEIPKFEELEFDTIENFEMFPVFQNVDEYTRRLRILAEFVIAKGYI